MSRTLSGTTGLGKAYTVNYPPQRVFAFSPYEVSFTVTGGAGLPYDINFNGFTVRRYLSPTGAGYFPLSGMLQSFFSNVEFGNVLGFASNVNAASKLMQLNKNIQIVVDGTTVTMNFDIIWGALQVGEREKTNETIYMFAGYPLTITQTIGNKTIWNAKTGVGYGKEVTLAGMYQTSGVARVVNSTDTETYKEYQIKFISCIPENSVYLRWVDIHGEYKYYLLQTPESSVSAEYGAMANVFPTVLDPSPTTLPSLIKNRVKYLEKNIIDSFVAGVMAADDKLTDHLISLNKSLKQWMYIDAGVWQEVVVSPATITKREREGLRQIDFEISIPLYNQRL